MKRNYLLFNMNCFWVHDTHAEAYPDWDSRPTIPNCPTCKNPVNNLDAYIQEKYNLQIYGRRLGDRISMHNGPGLYSKRFVDSFKKSSLTGIREFSPISFARIDSSHHLIDTSQQYFVPRIFEAGTLDYEKSEAQNSPACKTCLQPESNELPNRIILEPSGTQCGDVFSLKGQNWVFVSEDFKTFCEDNQFTNFQFSPISGLGSDVPLEVLQEANYIPKYDYDFERRWLQKDEKYRSLVKKIQIIGVHKYPYKMQEILDELKYAIENWPKEQSEREIIYHKQQYEAVYVLEISIPPELWFNFGFLVQGFPVLGADTSNLQVPYEPKLINPQNYRWAFFLHCIRLAKPAPVYGYEEKPFSYLGIEILPPPVTELPDHLGVMKYEWPS